MPSDKINRHIERLSRGTDYDRLSKMRVVLSAKLTRRRRKQIRAAFNKKRPALVVASLITADFVERLITRPSVHEVFKVSGE